MRRNARRGSTTNSQPWAERRWKPRKRGILCWQNWFLRRRLSAYDRSDALGNSPCGLRTGAAAATGGMAPGVENGTLVRLPEWRKKPHHFLSGRLPGRALVAAKCSTSALLWFAADRGPAELSRF